MVTTGVRHFLILGTNIFEVYRRFLMISYLRYFHTFELAAIKLLPPTPTYALSGRGFLVNSRRYVNVAGDIFFITSYIDQLNTFFFLNGTIRSTEP